MRLFYKVIFANSVMALTVITALLFFQTAMVAGVVIVACGVTNALLVRLAIETERQRINHRKLLAWTLKESEAERSRIARHLQDDAAQRLAALVLRSSGNADFSAEAIAVMEDLNATAEQLNPPGIKHLGLQAALGWLARSLERDTGLIVNFSVDAGADRLELSLSLGVYRILQDILTKAAERPEEPVELRVQRSRARLNVAIKTAYMPTADEQFRLAERTAVLGGETGIKHYRNHAVMALSIPALEREEHVGYDSRLAG